MTLILRTSLIKKKTFLNISGKSPLGGESLVFYSHDTSLKPRNLSDNEAKGATKKRSMLCSIFLENAHQNIASTLLSHWKGSPLTPISTCFFIGDKFIEFALIRSALFNLHGISHQCIHQSFQVDYCIGCHWQRCHNSWLTIHAWYRRAGKNLQNMLKRAEFSSQLNTQASSARHWDYISAWVNRTVLSPHGGPDMEITEMKKGRVCSVKVLPSENAVAKEEVCT